MISSTLLTDRGLNSVISFAAHLAADDPSIKNVVSSTLLTGRGLNILISCADQFAADDPSI
jgi:hypothetical protein